MQLAPKKGFLLSVTTRVSGHGKGLVGTIGIFGTKDQLKKAVVTKDLCYDLFERFLY